MFTLAMITSSRRLLHASVCTRCLACTLFTENTFYLTRTNSEHLRDEHSAGLHVPVYQVPCVNALDSQYPSTFTGLVP